MSIRVRLPLLVMALAACGGSPVRGAEVIPAGSEPKGRTLAAYRPSGCERRSVVRVVQTATAARLLVETTPGYDSLVVPSSSDSGKELVFQAVLHSDGGRARVHEFRVPADFSGAGRLSVRPGLECRLEPEGG
jgi:hypothetical protein